MGFWSSSKAPAPTNSSDDAVTPAPTAVNTSVASETTADPPKGPTEHGGCPMHRADGSYSYDWQALWRAGFPHSPGGSKPLPPDVVAAAQSSTPSGATGECPIKSVSPSGGCPVKSNQAHPEYNVYSQPIDPTNQMPFSPNQLPAPSQSVPLSTERVASTIPKGGAASEGSTWMFPSPQMFYNALARKGKLDETIEHDMESVVALHNNMNEKTWHKVLEWEHVTASSTDGTTPKLLKFQGRPTDLSPKAALKHYLLGHPLPYDRHDWVIERPDGTTVRYVIDYYHDESRARDDPDSARPALHDYTDGSNSLLVDVRPALDSLGACWNRIVTMPYAQNIAQTTRFESLPLVPTTHMKGQVQESVHVWQSIQAASQESQRHESGPENAPKLSEAQARQLAQQFNTLRTTCRAQQMALDTCTTEQDYARASLDVTICMAQTLCPVQHTALVHTLGEAKDDAIAQALTVVQDCVTLQAEHHAAAKTQYPRIFK